MAVPALVAATLYSALLVGFARVQDPAVMRMYWDYSAFKLRAFAADTSAPPSPLGPQAVLTAVTVDLELGDQEHLLDLLTTFERNGICATFFVLGEFADTYPYYVKMIAEAGHEVAAHTHGHPDLTSVSSEQMARDISRNLHSLEQLVGEPVLGFRPPYLVDSTLTIAWLPTMGVEYYASDLSASEIAALGPALSWCPNANRLSVSEFRVRSGPLRGRTLKMSDYSIVSALAGNEEGIRTLVWESAQSRVGPVVLILHPKTLAEHPGLTETWLGALSASGARFVTMRELNSGS